MRTVSLLQSLHFRDFYLSHLYSFLGTEAFQLKFVCVHSAMVRLKIGGRLLLSSHNGFNPRKGVRCMAFGGAAKLFFSDNGLQILGKETGVPGGDFLLAAFRRWLLGGD